jgi:hypothetical protein
LQGIAMSEYQYYEFRTIDKPLDESEIDELRDLSSRAVITSTSFTNTYNYGDFRGDPNALMDRYFDAFVYVANWGTRRLMFRIPRQFLDAEAAEDYCTDTDENALSLKAKKNHVVLEFSSEDEDSEWTDGEPWMPSLVALRDEIMRGDLRALYLGWLASLWLGDRDDDDPEAAQLEPPVPPGLSKLSTPLRSLAEFLRIDDALIEAAAQGSEGEAPAEPSRYEFARWVKKLPTEDKDDCLMRLIDGERDILILAELSRRFREDTAPKGARPKSGAKKRMVAQLLEVRDNLAAERNRTAAEKAAREKAERDRKRNEERARHLDQLALREAETWREIGKLLSTTLPKNYDRAVELLVDLRDLARRDGHVPETEKRIQKLREDHRNKPSLLKRLDREKLGSQA